MEKNDLSLSTQQGSVEEQEDSCCSSSCSSDFTRSSKEEGFSKYKDYFTPVIISILLVIGLALEHFKVSFFQAPFPLLWFGIIYLVIGYPVLMRSYNLIFKGDIYNEFVLMSVATIGAFLIGSYAEGIAVMLFYVVGELFQESAVNRAKKSIETLLKIQIEEVTVVENGLEIIKHPKEISVGQIIIVKAGQKIALDGQLVSEFATLNTTALTGESKPDDKKKGDNVLAGMINLNKIIEIKVTHLYQDSKLSNILKMVQEAVAKKAKTQLLISRLAKIYTPIVFWLAIALLCLPYLFLGNDYVFQVWFQRALIFLVISCPCALVVSIPLGYFGGIGAGSRNGILFKGSNYLELMTKVDTIVMDKTGTLTKGVFEVQDVISLTEEKTLFLKLVSSLERNSTHPIADAIVKYVENLKTKNHSAKQFSKDDIKDIEEFSGYGMKGKIGTFEVLAGNIKLLEKFNISYDENLKENTETIVIVAINNEYAGYIRIADTIKEDAKDAILALKKIEKIRQIVMLSGDKQLVVDKVARQLGIETALGDLLPEDKMAEVEKLKAEGKIIAFIGDGINDAPVITLSDVGMAMGGLGSDAAIETADVIIQTDQPLKIATAIKIGYETNRIIMQNIVLAFTVKFLVLCLGAIGMATLWQAVIADVGVALLAIMNSVRINAPQTKRRSR